MLRIAPFEQCIVYEEANSCAFAKQCKAPKKCVGISIVVDEDHFQTAKSLGLKPEIDRLIHFTGSDPETNVTKISLCEPALTDPRIVGGVKLLMAEVDADAFVEPSELPALREVEAVYSGHLTDIDQVATDKGLQAVEFVTGSTSSSFYPTGDRLAEEGGRLVLVPIYDFER
ncbi:hypothetical protein A3F37_00515 [Candidatus Saccharibacteria bacterium RIFCSPHIGHO2_12_FULL_41_12]|nr:MAG: hypothetical protein A3F37_00515 [Candidatus Saccharibacteria bacterium RIFCSPHIGHO2_12_FULL_41_12]